MAMAASEHEGSVYDVPRRSDGQPYCADWTRERLIAEVALLHCQNAIARRGHGEYVNEVGMWRERATALAWCVSDQLRLSQTSASLHAEAIEDARRWAETYRASNMDQQVDLNR